MRSIKKFFAITLLALVVGLGTPTAFAVDGVAESPGMGTEKIVGGPVETSQPAEYKGVAESPGFMDMILIYLDVII